jgi:hypothetical protein
MACITGHAEDNFIIADAAGCETAWALCRPERPSGCIESLPIGLFV